jgi:hypothetical protein
MKSFPKSIQVRVDSVGKPDLALGNNEKPEYPAGIETGPFKGRRPGRDSAGADVYVRREF